MRPILGVCPACGETLNVTRLHCRSCDTIIEGQFSIGAFDRLSPEHLAFAEAFIRCEGKLNRMEELLNLSYPTLRARLNDLRRAMGFEVGQEETPAGISDEERRQVLDDLAAGRIKSDDAIKLLHN
ncbi:MAG TPA: DUF2089 domain-containing protein [Anaerolineales bacterium]|nr:DUF2089 domain-containing protein [Anaerolineales bacterium]